MLKKRRFTWYLVTHLKATASRMALTRWFLVVEGLRPIREAQALGSFKGAFNEAHTNVSPKTTETGVMILKTVLSNGLCIFASRQNVCGD